MKQWHHAKRGLQSLSVHSKHRCLPSDTKYLRAEPGLWFPCRRVVQDRGWHMATFTGRNLINHSHYLSIPCTWAHSPPAQNQQSVSPEPQEQSDGWQRTKRSNAAATLHFVLRAKVIKSTSEDLMEFLHPAPLSPGNNIGTKYPHTYRALLS